MNKLLDQLLQTALKSHASDLHITAGHKPSLRIDGKLIGIKTSPLSAEQTEELILGSMSEDKQDFFRNHYEVDYSYVLPTGERFRVNAYRSQGNYEAVFRVVLNKAFTLTELNLPEKIEELGGNTNGLVLVAGATSSGKSTTLSALLDKINSTREVRIITIENPIEIIHSNKKAIISQREIGLDTLDFPSALRSALRQDPDIIVIGEIRDRETASIALEAAQTGHLVLSTVHASDTGDAINRFINLFSEDDRSNVRRMFAENMKAVVAQRLAVDVKGKRIPVVEVLINTQRVAEHIKGLDSASIVEIIHNTAGSVGMQSFEDHLVKLVEEKKISMASAKKLASDGQSLVLRMRKNGLS